MAQGPPGYGPPGYGPPGYGPPGHGPPGYVPPGYGPPKRSGNTALIVAMVIGAVVVVLVFLSTFAIYGVRRYLQSAKVSQAKNTVAAISRSAAAAFERRSAPLASQHELCGSASAVPATIPSGSKYQPDPSPGADFETGSESAGWTCLKFTIVKPIFYRYEYRAGGGYKGPARGGPDPGSDGFEVSAEGDLDGDGITSLFTQTGKIDRASNKVTVDPKLFIVDEFE